MYFILLTTTQSYGSNLLEKVSRVLFVDHLESMWKVDK